MIPVVSYLSIMYVLFARDMRQWLNNIRAEAINASILAFFEIMLYGLMLPAMGMDAAKSVSYYIGSVVWVGFLTQYAQSVEIMTGVVQAGRIKFDSLLPLPWSLLLMRFILTTSMQATLLMIPILLAGIAYFGVHLVIPQFLYLICFILFSQITLATIFVYLGFTADQEWMLTNAWPQLLAIMTCLGCLFFGFNDIARIYPRSAYLLLINPVVSTSEGIRALTNQPHALPIGVCLFCLSILLVTFYYGTYRCVRKKLDIV